MKSATLVALTMASSAAAFAPSTSQRSSSALNAGMPDRLWNDMVDKTERSKACPWLPRAKALDGTMAGDEGFDPFYLSSIPKNFAGFIQPPSWEETEGIPTIYWMREAEVKHARVAMLAVAGWWATDGALGVPIRFPGSIFSVENIPTAYQAHDTLVAQGAMGFMLLAVGLMEIVSGATLVQVSKGELSDRAPGDFNWDPMNFSKNKSAEQKKVMETKEIRNGRLAMLAFGGIATQTALGDAYHSFPYF